MLLLLAGPVLAASGEEATDGETSSASGASGRKESLAAFTLEVSAPEALRQHLLQHLDILQYRSLQDLDRDELERLMQAAQTNAQELLATEGYFSAQVQVSARDTPEGPAPWAVEVQVDAGEPVRISRFAIRYSGAITQPARDQAAQVQAEQKAIDAAWALRPGQIFTQAAWDSAKTEALRRLTATRYPTGHITASQAAIRPETHEAELTLELDSGPDYRFGPIQVEGLQHYPPELVRRLAQIPPGSLYTQARLLEAQQRVADSGYFDSVFMSIDTQGDPQAAVIRVQVREAKRKKLVLGLGASTDSGARLSSEYTDLQLPGLDWRETSKLSLDRETKTLGTELSSQPDDGNWRWVTSGQAQRQLGGTAPVNSVTLRAGRTKTDEQYDRNAYLQYDHAITQSSPPENASSLSANYAWTQRNFDNIPFPTRGYGLAVELGAGLTLGSQRDPYLRTRARAQGFVPLGGAGQTGAATPRIGWRAEAGAVMARSDAVLPSTQLFLTGGDTTVRGYGYRDIGVVQADGSLAAGRYLAVTSLEWQKPIVRNGHTTDWEGTVFMDSGAVADQIGALRAKVGVGVGARWRSPVGPLEMDLAWGVATRRLRLHLNVGFSF
ncbi:MAG: BamA/TamA family outer membrane protein [Curvibacter sp.]|nr:BamA/TamA family outer membrane protein [Curvibacter sp.]